MSRVFHFACIGSYGRLKNFASLLSFFLSILRFFFSFFSIFYLFFSVSMWLHVWSRRYVLPDSTGSATISLVSAWRSVLFFVLTCDLCPIIQSFQYLVLGSTMRVTLEMIMPSHYWVAAHRRMCRLLRFTRELKSSCYGLLSYRFLLLFRSLINALLNSATRSRFVVSCWKKVFLYAAKNTLFSSLTRRKCCGTWVITGMKNLHYLCTYIVVRKNPCFSLG